MTKEASNGAGTLRPSAQTVKTEKSPSNRKASKPGTVVTGEKITLRFVNEDGLPWRSIKTDRSLVENAVPFAAAAGRTIEEFIVDALELAADSRPGKPAVATMAKPCPVIIELTAKQYAMVKRVAEYDHRPSVAAWIMHETEKAIITSADCFDESQDEHQAAWDGKEAA